MRLRPVRHSRRGSIYVAVLGFSLLITVTGLSAIAALRINQRTARETFDATRAEVEAESATEYFGNQLANDPAWRSHHTDSQWEPAIPMNGSSWQYMLVDEEDGDLANDNTDDARLYVRVSCGTITRTASVLMRPMTRQSELLRNRGMELGTADWLATGSAALAPQTVEPYSGGAAVTISGRGWSTHAIRQDVTTEIVSGETYATMLWVKPDFGLPLAFNVYLRAEASGGTQTSKFTAWTTGTDWQPLVGNLQVSWSGTLNAAYFGVDTVIVWPDFDVDDASLIGFPQNPLTVFAPVPGTWRTEVDETPLPPL